MDNCDVYNAPKKTVGMSGEIRIYFSMCEKTDEALQCRKNEKKHFRGKWKRSPSLCDGASSHLFLEKNRHVFLFYFEALIPDKT